MDWRIEREKYPNDRDELVHQQDESVYFEDAGDSIGFCCSSARRTQTQRLP